MIKLKSDYFFRNSDSSANRLDYVYHHPQYDQVKRVIQANVFRDLAALIPDNLMQYGLTASGKDTGETPFINIENLETDGRVNQADIRYVDDVPPEMLLRQDDILISRSRLVGVCAVASAAEENCAFGSYIIRFKAKTEEIVPLYLAKFINSRLGQTQIDYLQTGSSGNNINTNQIGRIRVLYVDRDIQARLVEEVIQLEDRAKDIDLQLVDFQQQANRLLMNELGLGTTDLTQYFYSSGKDDRSPFFARDFESVAKANRLNLTFYDPKLNFIDRLADKYSTTSLDNICRSINRGEQPEYDAEGDILAIKTVDLKNAFIDYERCLRVSHDFYDDNPQAQVKRNNLLVSSTGYMSLGKVDLFDQNYRAIADGHVSILRLKEGYDPRFVTYLLRSEFGKMQFEKWWTGSSGQIEIRRDDLASFIIPDNCERTGIPLKRQEQIAERIVELFGQVKQLQSDRNRLLKEANDIFEGFVEQQIKV